MSEVCSNPFRTKKCGNTDIKIYITDEKIPICTSCWDKISDKDFEWNKDDTMETLRRKHKREKKNRVKKVKKKK